MGEEATTNEPVEVPKVKVLVALQNIGQANMIDPALLELREFEQPQAPADALMSTADIAGKLAAVDIAQGQIVRRDMVTDRENHRGTGRQCIVPHPNGQGLDGSAYR